MRCKDGCKRSYPFPIAGATFHGPDVSGPSPSSAGRKIPAIDKPISLSRTELAVRVGSKGVRETELLEIAQEFWKALTPIEECRR